jgi:hypothetical protein
MTRFIRVKDFEKATERLIPIDTIEAIRENAPGRGSAIYIKGAISFIPVENEFPELAKSLAKVGLLINQDK